MTMTSVGSSAVRATIEANAPMLGCTVTSTSRPGAEAGQHTMYQPWIRVRRRDRPWRDRRARSPRRRRTVAAGAGLVSRQANEKEREMEARAQPDVASPGRIVVPAREGRGVRLNAGDRFRCVDLEGHQCGDLFAFSASDVREYASAEHTRVMHNRLFPHAARRSSRTSGEPYSSSRKTIRPASTTC